MDLQKIISDLVSRLTGNNDLIAKFTADPLKLIKNLLNIDLDPKQLTEVVKGVCSKLNIDPAEVLKQGSGILGKLKSILGK